MQSFPFSGKNEGGMHEKQSLIQIGEEPPLQDRFVDSMYVCYLYMYAVFMYVCGLYVLNPFLTPFYPAFHCIAKYMWQLHLNLNLSSNQAIVR